jgi:hypothetical protein
MYFNIIGFTILLIQIFISNGFVFNYLFDPMNVYSSESGEYSDFDIDAIKNTIIQEINQKNKQIEKEKYQSVLEKEKKLKDELYKVIKENIIKQMEIDNENKKMEKYYGIMKKNYRKNIDENNEDELIKFVENKLNSHQ